ncbi:phospholipase [Dyadobacter luteus]|uniref:Phospholipase n=1 Tax=Dyadobacter luteus TaxID=2259619 RepID=A0A3D8YFM9_9BACT|nr:dienelactone hydrolase family protein [Dyadobacter luteus]REA63461.1 phospholipase [Dyadobacter luteus]
MYQHTKQIVKAGVALQDAKKAIVMIHGRGAAPEDIISLKRYLNLNDVAILAPAATNNSWYPFSFMAPVEKNQPALDSALALIDDTVKEIEAAGIAADQIYFAGFSQGACLMLEYTARHARKYAGIIALTGGLVGEKLEMTNYGGDFENTPVFISTGDPDPHVPVSRVEESISVLKNLNAQVSSAIYPGRPHTISGEEIAIVNREILK